MTKSFRLLIAAQILCVAAAFTLAPSGDATKLAHSIREGDKTVHHQHGTATAHEDTKAEAYAEAIGRVPNNATPAGVSYSGSPKVRDGNTSKGTGIWCRIRWVKQ